MGTYQTPCNMKFKIRNAVFMMEKAQAILPLYVKLTKFLTDIGEYETADGLLYDVIARIKEECGEKSQLLCEPLFAIEKMLNVEGRHSGKPHQENNHVNLLGRNQNHIRLLVVQ